MSTHLFQEGQCHNRVLSASTCAQPEMKGVGRVWSQGYLGAALMILHSLDSTHRPVWPPTLAFIATVFGCHSHVIGPFVSNSSLPRLSLTKSEYHNLREAPTLPPGSIWPSHPRPQPVSLQGSRPILLMALSGC